MGNCFTKGEDKYKVDHDANQTKQNSTLMTSTQNYSDSKVEYLEDKSIDIDEERRIKRVNSITWKPGEEHLASKLINLDSFDIEKVIGKGGYGKVLLVK